MDINDINAHTKLLLLTKRLEDPIYECSSNMADETTKRRQYFWSPIDNLSMYSLAYEQRANQLKNVVAKFICSARVLDAIELAHLVRILTFAHLRMDMSIRSDAIYMYQQVRRISPEILRLYELMSIKVIVLLCGLYLFEKQACI